MKRISMLMALLAVAFAPAARAQTNPSVILNRHVFINLANDNGILFPNVDSVYCTNWPTTWPADQGPVVGDYCSSHPTNSSYFIKSDGGGTNENHIAATNDVASVSGSPIALTTAVPNPSGDLYATNTGGRGFDNDIILLVGVKGPIRNDFSLTIQSSGYYWTPAYNDPAITGAQPTAGSPGYPTYVSGEPTYVTNAVNETFHAADFIYGPQTARPGPNGTGPANVDCTIPLYFGQDITDPSTAEYLMFVDLRAGNLKAANFPGMIDNGAVKIHYSFTGLDTVATLNTYGWVSESYQAEGINFTNNTNVGASTPSGFVVAYNGPATGSDTTPPTCALTNTIAGPPKQLEITVQDNGSGIASIVATTATNTTMNIPDVSSWPTTPVLVTATKDDQALGARVVLQVTDAAGNVTTCDPEIPGESGTSATPAASVTSAGGGCSSSGTTSLAGVLGLLAAAGLVRCRRSNA